VFEIDSDALLAQVVAQKRRPDVALVDINNARRSRSARLAGRRMLDLHHISAHPREELRPEGHRLHLLDRQDTDPLEGLFHT